ncbi:MAG: hypothetical protein COA95_09830 [Methylophaga sp.]|nr:MAG: hypothetical protein COA95_09830 [Methylophaga sp.]
MTDKRKPYKTYTKEFKIEAVRLMTGSDTSPAQLAMELGIRRNQLYKWKEQLEDKGDDAFPNKLGRPRKEEQSDMATLRQENKRLKEEVEILKKAAVDSSEQRNSYTKILICRRAFDETNEAHIYSRGKRFSF